LLRVSRAQTPRCVPLLLHHDKQHACTCVDTQEKTTHCINDDDIVYTASACVVLQKKKLQHARRNRCSGQHHDVDDVSSAVVADVSFLMCDAMACSYPQV